MYKLVVTQDWQIKKTKEIYQYNIVWIDLPAIFSNIKKFIYNLNNDSNLVHLNKCTDH